MSSRQSTDTADAPVDGYVKFRENYVQHCKDSESLWNDYGWQRVSFETFLAKVEASQEAGDGKIYGAFPMYDDIKAMNQAPVDILFREFKLHQWCKMAIKERERPDSDPNDPVFETFIDPTNRKLLLTQVGSNLLMSYPYRTVSRLSLPQTWLDLSKAVVVWKRGFDDYTTQPYGPTYTEWSDDASYEQAIEDCRRNAWLPPPPKTSSNKSKTGPSSSSSKIHRGAPSSDAVSVAGSSASSPSKSKKGGDAYKAWKKEQNATKRARKEARKAEVDEEDWMR